jgi:parvulin-like peptidyl-prolyl isomerase
MLLRNLLLVLLAPWAGALAQGMHPGDAVRVNGEAISYQRFNGFYVEYRNSKGVAVGARGDQLDLLTKLRSEAMDRMVDQALVAQAAERAGFEVADEDVDAAVDELRSVFAGDDAFIMKLEGEGFTEESFREHIGSMIAAKRYLDGIRLEASAVSDTELERYYRENEYRLTLPEQVRVRHILLTWKPLGKQDDRAAIREQMEPILERAQSGEDFAALATEFSDDYATKQSGGDTGLFRRGQMAAAFEEAAFALQAGEISGPVETAFGVHIMHLEERQESYLLPLDEIRDQLREHIRNEKSEQAVNNEIEQLRAEANIDILIALGPRPTDQEHSR